MPRKKRPNAVSGSQGFKTFLVSDNLQPLALAIAAICQKHQEEMDREVAEICPGIAGMLSLVRAVSLIPVAPGLSEVSKGDQLITITSWADDFFTNERCLRFNVSPGVIQQIQLGLRKMPKRKTVGEIVSMTPRERSLVKGWGKSCLPAIETMLAEFGFGFM